MKLRYAIDFFKDLSVFLILVYCGLLILNVVFENFVAAIFPLPILGWITVFILAMYVLLLFRNSITNR